VRFIELCRQMGLLTKASVAIRSHKAILDDQFKGISWSSATMTFVEVQAILGSLRTRKRCGDVQGPQPKTSRRREKKPRLSVCNCRASP
jgi:hypothetical protein